MRRPSSDGDFTTAWERVPRWLHISLTAIGFLWLVGCTAYLFYTRVLVWDLGAGTKALFAAMCFSIVAFALNAVWPSPGQAKIRPADMGDFWPFVFGPAPESQPLQALHSKMRRAVLFMVAGGFFMLASMVARVLGY